MTSLIGRCALAFSIRLILLASQPTAWAALSEVLKPAFFLKVRSHCRDGVCARSAQAAVWARGVGPLCGLSGRCRGRISPFRGCGFLLPSQYSQRLGRHRWTVQGTVAWLAGCRRLHRRYERKAEHFLAFAGIAGTLICYRRLDG